MREISKNGGATGVCAGCLWHSLCATPATAATCAHGGRQSECVQVPDRASGCPQAWPVVRGLVHTGATDALVDRPPVPSVHRQAASVGGGDSVEVHSTLEELTPAQRVTVPAVSPVHRQAASVGGGDSVEVHGTLEELTPSQRATGGAPAWFVWLGYLWHVVVYGAAAFGFLTAYFLLTVAL